MMKIKDWSDFRYLIGKLEAYSESIEDKNLSTNVNNLCKKFEEVFVRMTQYVSIKQGSKPPVESVDRVKPGLIKRPTAEELKKRGTREEKEEKVVEELIKDKVK